MAAQIKLLPDQQYIQDGLRGGTITLQEVSIKAIDADVKYQARVMSIDMNHVRKLASIRDTTEQPLAPIVVFLKKGGRYQIGDGFHRLKEAMIRKDVSIRAYVVKVEDWEHDCRLFAAMCNQELCLPRTKEDIRKAVELLFADPVCWEWANTRIAEHCGSSGITVMRHRINYSSASGIPLPDYFVTKNGVMKPRNNQTRIKKTIVGDNYISYRASIGGKKIHLGTTEDKAKAKLDEITKRRNKDRLTLRCDNMREFLFRKSIASFPVTIKGWSATSGAIAGNHIFVTTTFSAPNSVVEAVGKLVLLRQQANQKGLELAVICYVEDGPSALIKLARGAGIEFLSPEEFADSIKAKKEGVA